MSKITISDELRDEFLKAGSVVELYDAAGGRVGTAYISAPEPTLEELRALSANAKGWVSAEDVTERLRRLTKCE